MTPGEINYRTFACPDGCTEEEIRKVAWIIMLGSLNPFACALLLGWPDTKTDDHLGYLAAHWDDPETAKATGFTYGKFHI